MKETALTPQQFQAAVQNLVDISDTLEALPPMSLASLSPEETLIFSVDINNGFTKFGPMSSDRIGEIIPTTADFVNRSIKSGYKVIGFTDTHTSDSPELRAFPTHCLEDDPESALVDELSAIDRVYPKNSTNAFFAGGQNLVSTAIKNYVVTGCCTDICIYQFALSLRAYLNHNNFEGRVIVPLSLVETYDGPGHNAALFNLVFAAGMMQNGIEVVADFT